MHDDDSKWKFQFSTKKLREIERQTWFVRSDNPARFDVTYRFYVQ